MTVKILVGDVLAMLATLADDSVDCVVTSPPYWGLRDYGVEGQIGLERTLGEHLAVMIAVFREVRRVLKPTGTLWLNYGDCYATTPNGRSAADTKAAGNDDRTFRDKPFSTIGGVLKAKDLAMLPNRLAIALQEPWYDGKIKSVADRVWLAAMIDAEGCMFIHKRKAGTSNHSSFTKKDGTVSRYSRTSDTYSAGLEVANTSLAVVERCIAVTGIGSVCTQGPEQNARRKQTLYRWNVRSNECRWIIEEVYPHLVAKQQQARVLLNCPSSGEKAAAAHAAIIDLHNGKQTDVDGPAPRSRFQPGWYVRSEIIWHKPNGMPESIRDRPTTSHEKVFLLTKAERYFYDAGAIREPCESGESDLRKMRESLPRIGGKHKDLDDPLSKASSKTNIGRKRSVGSPDGRNARNVWTIGTQSFSDAHFATFPPELVERCLLAGCPAGGHVLDPFGGAGTTGLVADRLGRNATLIELNPQYAAMAQRRIQGDAPLFAEVEAP